MDFSCKGISETKYEKLIGRAGKPVPGRAPKRLMPPPALRLDRSPVFLICVHLRILRILCSSSSRSGLARDSRSCSAPGRTNTLSVGTKTGLLIRGRMKHAPHQFPGVGKSKSFIHRLRRCTQMRRGNTLFELLKYIPNDDETNLRYVGRDCPSPGIREIERLAVRSGRGASTCLMQPPVLRVGVLSAHIICVHLRHLRILSLGLAPEALSAILARARSRKKRTGSLSGRGPAS